METRKYTKLGGVEAKRGGKGIPHREQRSAEGTESNCVDGSQDPHATTACEVPGRERGMRDENPHP